MPTRRDFVKTASLLTGAMVLEPPVHPTEVMAAVENAAALELTINGEHHRVRVDPRVTLLDLLRENLALTGAKKGCDHGQCGACTVLVNGRRINSCLSLAVTHQGDEITTIEGLAEGDKLHPVQEAFLSEGAFQCGYCTTGMIMGVVGLLNDKPNPSEADIL